jgi:uncharacterized repeat protein (TIGR03803 family)
MISEAEWRATRGKAACGWLARTAQLAIAATTFLILSALPLQAQTETVLHSFAGAPTDGGTPSGTLVEDASGNLYGTTQIGGASGFGIVFELVASENFKEKVLYSFAAAGGDGQGPEAGLVVDGSGNLFGTTQFGGTSTNCQFGCGTVFELVNSSGNYTEKVLYSFTGHPDGQSPGALLIDASGNLYGTTVFGGTSKSSTICKTGCGIVFELANNSGTYTYSVLYNFLVTGGDGINPAANLVMDSAGNLYGTTGAGGIAATGCLIGCGTVFELVKGSGGYTETLPPLYSFTGIADGFVPGNLVIQEVSGNIFLYGSAGGGTSTGCIMGCGIVFQVDNSSGTFKKSLLFSFAGSPDVQGGEILLMDTSGNFYGIGGGGNSTACVGCGTVFKLHPNGDGTYAESVLYNFKGSPDGAVPTGLIVDVASGNFFGPTGSGGTSTVCGLSGCGTVFEITQGSTGSTIVISATSGSGQTAKVNTQFASPLQVTALDSRNQLPVNGLTVTFTAPANGASGIFSGGVDTAVTNTSGIATSQVFTANGTAGGPYTVTATAPNVSGTATFTLTNLPAQISTMVSVSTSSSDHGDALPSNDALVGNPITVSFKVSPASGSATPTGKVVVTDGLGDTCTPSPVILNSASAGAGSCALTITTLPASGTATLTATYTPDTNVFSGSTGTASESVVEISACGSSVPEQVVKQGATITYSFTVCVAGNANAVAPVANVVDCVPRGKCTLAITQIGQTGVYTVAVTIVTTCGDCKTLIVSPPRSSPGRWPLTLLCFGALLAMLMARQNQARPRLLYAAGILIAIVLCGMPGCGGGSSQVTPVGMYTVSVKVAAGNFNVVVPANLMVEK